MEVFYTMKKLISFLLILAMAFSLVACGNKTEKKEAEKIVWDGYKDVDFKKFLEEGLGKLYGDDCELTVRTEDGWIETEELNAADVGENKTAVTYVIEVRDTVNEQEMSFYFYMARENNVLSAQGATAKYDAENLSAINAEEATAMLEQVIEYYEGDAIAEDIAAEAPEESSEEAIEEATEETAEESAENAEVAEEPAKETAEKTDVAEESAEEATATDAE